MDGRTETGPLQINDDWPGLFIRGDNAFALAMALKQFLHDPNECSPIYKMQVENIVDLLQSCNVRNLK